MKIGNATIGLLSNVENGKYVFNEAYYNFAKELGFVSLITPRDKTVYDFDLIILPGGPDVAPMRYNQAPHEFCQNPHYNYEYFDMEILPQYIAQNVPVLGICRGMQSINVLFGGSLFQNICEPTSVSYRWEHVHDALDKRTGRRFGVNSLHHQAIDKLGDGLEVLLIGKSSKRKEKDQDLHIEAFRHVDKPILGVQFHPEELFDDPNSRMATEWIYSEIEKL